MTVGRRLLQIASVVGLVLFVSWRIDRTADDAGTRRTRTAGLWFSPWLVVEDSQRRLPGGRFAPGNTLTEVTFLSWSWLCLVPVVLVSHRRKADDRRSPDGPPV